MIKIVAEINGQKEPLAQPAKYIDPKLFQASAGESWRRSKIVRSK